MRKDEVRSLGPGLYRVYWKSGGYSLAAVGVTADGGRWIAPVNWIAPSVEQKHWRRVERVEKETAGE